MNRVRLNQREEQWHQVGKEKTLPPEIKQRLEERQALTASDLATKDFMNLKDIRSQFYDAVICVDDKRFTVDRNVMASCSPYFQALFADKDRRETSKNKYTKDISADKTSDGKEKANRSSRIISKKSARPSTSNHEDVVRGMSCLPMPSYIGPALASGGFIQRTVADQIYLREPVVPRPALEVTVTGVTADIMQHVIEHAYGGHVHVSGHNFDRLIVAADMFQIPSLLETLCTFLESQISYENCISIVKFVSNFFHCEKTRLKGTQYFLDNFTDVVRISPDFYNLTVDELEAVLKADRLNVRHEEEVLDAVVRWAARPGRDHHIPRLVGCARIGLMVDDNINAFANTWMTSCNDVTMQVMETVLEQYHQQTLNVDVSRFSPRLPRDILIVVGGSNFGHPLNVVEAYDCRTRLWFIIPSDDFAPRSYHGMVTLHRCLWLVGGYGAQQQQYLSSCVKFDPEALSWTPVTPMNARRCYVGCAVLRGHIYAVGGYDGLTQPDGGLRGNRLDSAERFSPERNQWSFISPMLQQRSDAGVAVLHDKLYVCGGFTGLEYIHAAEVYDPDTDQWAALRAMLTARSGLGLLAYQDCLYAVGGFDGIDNAVRLRSAELYVPATDEWLPLPSMTCPRSNMGVEVLEGVMYAIGGYNGKSTTAVVEGYEFATNTWFEGLPRLSQNRSALCVGLLRSLSNTAELLGRKRPSLVERDVATNSSAQ